MPASTSPVRTPVQRYRILVLPFAAIVIASLVVWRMRIDGQSPATAGAPPAMVMAQSFPFSLADQHRHVTRLQGYLGRTKLILVFFDGTKPAHLDPVVARLRDDYDRLKAAGVQPLAVSTASPFAIQKSEELAGQRFPFPILMDVDPNGLIPTPAHMAWSLAQPGSETLRQGTFLIDRMGRVSAHGTTPRPVKDPQHVIDTILRGEWKDDSDEPAPAPASAPADAPAAT